MIIRALKMFSKNQSEEIELQSETETAEEMANLPLQNHVMAISAKRFQSEHVQAERAALGDFPVNLPPMMTHESIKPFQPQAKILPWRGAAGPSRTVA